jgi:hypothetical protein
MHFDGAFNLPGVGAGAVLTSPSGGLQQYRGIRRTTLWPKGSKRFGHQAPHCQGRFTAGRELLQKELHSKG